MLGGFYVVRKPNWRTLMILLTMRAILNNIFNLSFRIIRRKNKIYIVIQEEKVWSREKEKDETIVRYTSKDYPLSEKDTAIKDVLSFFEALNEWVDTIDSRIINAIESDLQTNELAETWRYEELRLELQTERDERRECGEPHPKWWNDPHGDD